MLLAMPRDVSTLLPTDPGNLFHAELHVNVKAADATKKQYMAIKNPPGNPPAYIFAPVWTVLYGAMGYAAYRAYDTALNSFNAETMMLAKHGATLYTIQLGLNLIWMPLFFGFKRPIEASIDIVALVGTTGYLTYVWSKVDQVAAWTMVPYLGWLCFATYLCVSRYQSISLTC
jgi:benzodiazapine receptor